MTEEEAWIYVQKHFKKHGVKNLDTISAKDWFTAGFHIGATENNAAYFTNLLNSISVERLDESDAPPKAKKLRPKDNHRALAGRRAPKQGNKRR